MTPEQMEALADIIASRLMGTFAGRLDMIEEVVFSAPESAAIDFPSRHKMITAEASVLALVSERELTVGRLCTLLRKRAPFKSMGDAAYNSARNELLRLISVGWLFADDAGVVRNKTESVFSKISQYDNAILKCIGEGKSILQICQLDSIRSITNLDVGRELFDIVEHVLESMVMDGRVVKWKSSANCFKYKQFKRKDVF